MFATRSDWSKGFKSDVRIIPTQMGEQTAARSTNSRTSMSIWRLSGMRTRARLVIVAATLTLFPVITAEQIEAQSGRSMAIDDQPGVVPDPRDERLSAAFSAKQSFTGPTNLRAPSSSIPQIATYTLFKETTERSAMALGSVARDSSGRDFCRSAARENGRTGRRHRK